MSFHDFVQKYNLKNKSKSIMKIYKVLKKTGLDSKVWIYLRDGDLSTNFGIVNLHPSRGIHWVCFFKDCFFFSYGCSLPKKLPNYLIT